MPTNSPALVNPMIKPAVHRLAPNVWLVTETAKAGGLYQVRYRGHRYTCTCPDHRHRRRDCRHIRVIQSL